MGYSFVPAGSIAVAQFGTQFLNLSKIGEEYHEIKSKSKFKFPIWKYRLWQCQPENRQVVRSCNIYWKKAHKKPDENARRRRQNTEKLTKRKCKSNTRIRRTIYFKHKEHILFSTFSVRVCVCFCFKQGIVKLLLKYVWEWTYTHSHACMHALKMVFKVEL